MLKRTIQFQQGFDYIVNGPKEKAKYGRHGMSIRFILSGTKGAVTLLLFTDWLPRNYDKNTMMWKPTFIMPNLSFGWPMAADIGYHSPKPLYDWHKKSEPSQKKCPFLDNKPCWYDGSGLNAENYLSVFLNQGEEALWKKMKQYYDSTFNKK